MLTVIIQSLILASSRLLSVGSITLVILLLISDRGWRNGLGYALGYTSAYTAITRKLSQTKLFTVTDRMEGKLSSPEQMLYIRPMNRLCASKS